MSFLRFSFFRLILSLATGLLLHTEAAAQEFRGDAVYLSNGSVVSGRIIENDSINGLRIINECGIWFYTPNEFDSIGRQDWGRSFSAKERGYMNISTLALLFGYETLPVPSVSMVHAYKFNKRTVAGLGAAYEYFDWGVLPVFGDARYFFYDQGFSPFVFAQAGYAFTLEREPINYWGGSRKRSFGGPMLGGGAGIRAGITRNTAFVMSISYRFQRLSYESENMWEPGYKRKTIQHYNRIAFTLGFLFE